jgi:hypothetical protein
MNAKSDSNSLNRTSDCHVESFLYSLLPCTLCGLTQLMLSCLSVPADTDAIEQIEKIKEEMEEVFSRFS